jgi:putative transposase
MPYTKILVHYIWSTKNREHLISKELKPLLPGRIKENSIEKEIFIDTVVSQFEKIISRRGAKELSF